ncbi:protocatechuate 3,4-dioxygenase subunit alpha [Streptomyces sp. NPDC001941]|uniref:protocatechuate 3,4-dioxygenase subunit alpha n=1 Tax=Streptomyces sp. NPDC001941 TaxID=3154659 RepID=UPI00331DB129
MPEPTPSQTVGPFFGYALPYPGGPDAAPSGHPATLTVHGHVYDGEGSPVPDALLEFWQAGPDGSATGRPGSLARNGVDFTGFARAETDAAGHWTVRTLPPPDARPYLCVCVFARGLTHHLFTRLYVPGAPGDALLDALPAERRATLVAAPDGERTLRFDVHLQGEKETVFLVFGK